MNITDTPPHHLVLLVDDSTIDNFVSSKIIERYKFADKTTTFSRARQALNYLFSLSETNPDDIPAIIFLDLNMPEIDGFEFLRTFAGLSVSIKKKIKIVVLTTSINPSDMKICKDHSSVITFVHKPLMKSNLDIIDQLISEEQAIRISA